jgi:hypothetical protein
MAAIGLMEKGETFAGVDPRCVSVVGRICFEIPTVLPQEDRRP